MQLQQGAGPCQGGALRAMSCTTAGQQLQLKSRSQSSCPAKHRKAAEEQSPLGNCTQQQQQWGLRRPLQKRRKRRCGTRCAMLPHFYQSFNWPRV